MLVTRSHAHKLTEVPLALQISSADQVIFFPDNSSYLCAKNDVGSRNKPMVTFHLFVLLCFALLCFALFCFVLFCFVLFCFYINFNRHPFFLFSFVLPLIDNIVPPNQKIMCASRAGAQAIKDDGCEKFPSFQYLKACITKFGCKKSRAELRAK